MRHLSNERLLDNSRIANSLTEQLAVSQMPVKERKLSIRELSSNLSFDR